MITHPDRSSPEDGITKRELAAYYEAVAPAMLPYLRGRPVTLERYPSGIGCPGFWQKDVSRGFPDWLERVEVPKKGGVVHHPLAADPRSLLWMANQNTITLHVWLRSWVKTSGSKGFHVAVPLDGTADFAWSEVERGEVSPRSFTLRSLPARLLSVGDPWSDLPASGQSLGEPARRLRELRGRG